MSEQVQSLFAKLSTGLAQLGDKVSQKQKRACHGSSRRGRPSSMQCSLSAHFCSPPTAGMLEENLACHLHSHLPPSLTMERYPGGLPVRVRMSHRLSPGLGRPKGRGVLPSLSMILMPPDPNAPQMTWVHWVLYNLLSSARELAEAVASEAICLRIISSPKQ